MLIATVPDPRNSVVSYEFDTVLGAIERAAEHQGYVADRYYFPWLDGERSGSKSTGTADSAKEGILRIQLNDQGSELNLNGTVSSQRTPSKHQPGSVLFRRADPGARGNDYLLLLVLVPESPIWGIDKLALRCALDLADDLETVKDKKLTDKFKRHLLMCTTATTFGDGSTAVHWGSDFLEDLGTLFRCRTTRLVGPTFSASASSLIQATNDWLETKGTKRRFRAPREQFRWYNGCATEVSRAAIESAVPEIRFRSTLYPSNVLRRQLLNFLSGHNQGVLRRPDPDGVVDIALLIEANTGYAEMYSANKGREENENLDHPLINGVRFRYHYISYPINISQVRSAYKQSGLAAAPAPLKLASSERLAIPDDTGILPYKDLIPPATPSATAVADELSLSRLLDDLSGHNYQYVGVVSSNVCDQLFLFQKLRIACPNVQFMVGTPELLFSHHEVIPYLRGMLVASSYPLCPDNQSWSFPNRGDDRLIGFSSSAAPSIYNAAAAHLAEMTDPGNISLHLIEYGLPFDERPTTNASFRAPAVWISVVGQRGLYPVWAGEPWPIEPAKNKLAGRSSPAELLELGIYVPGEERIGREGFNTTSHSAIEESESLPALGGSWLVLFILLSLSLIIASLWILSQNTAAFARTVCFLLLTLGLLVTDAVLSLFQTQFSVGWSLLLVTGLSIFCLAWGGPDRLKKLLGLVDSRREIEQPEELEKGERRRRIMATTVALGLGFYLVFGTPLWALAWRRHFLGIPLCCTHLALGALATVLPAIFAVLWPELGGWLDHGRVWGSNAIPPRPDGTTRESNRSTPTPREELEARIKRWFLVSNQILRVGSVAIPAFIVVSFLVTESPRNLLLYVARATPITNGVTPLMPIVFLGFLGVAWQVCNWRWAWIAARHKETMPPEDTNEVGDVNLATGYLAADLQIILATYSYIGSCLEVGSWFVLLKADETKLGAGAKKVNAVKRRICVHWVVTLALASVVLALAWMRSTPTVEFFWFQVGYRLVFVVACLVILVKLMELLSLWSIAQGLMEAIGGLPIMNAFDRLPLRAGAFGRVTDRIPDQTEMAHLITRQAQVLARGFGEVRTSMIVLRTEILERGQGGGGPPPCARASGLPRPVLEADRSDHDRGQSHGTQDESSNESGSFDEVGHDLAETLKAVSDPFPPRLWRQLSRQLVRTVTPFWCHRTVGVAYADVARSRDARVASKASGDWDLRSVPCAGASGQSISKLKAWLTASEDYMALISVSRLSLVFAYVWTLIEFLVVGAIALYLSITSYPFLPQGFMLAAMGLMIAVLIVLVARIVIQINRNELVSRIQKTTPNKISFDHELVGSFFTYILPLFLALAALSVSLSDMFRSWFEPIFR
jgi:hypothetical protein